MLKLISLFLIFGIILILIFYKKEYIFNTQNTKKNLSRSTFYKSKKSKLKEFK